MYLYLIQVHIRGADTMNTQTIRERHSVRTFDKKSINPETLEEVKQWIESIDNPFHIPVSMQLLNKEEKDLSSPVLVDEEWYVAGKVPKVAHGEEAFGYSFEDFILKAQSLGLGSVWLAATIKRPAFEKAINLQSNEVMPAVSPLGYPATKRSNREKLMRKGMGSDTRRAFEDLFFLDSFQTPLLEEEAGEWKLPLEMVRLAPSATNKQPWRAIVDHNKVHFYEFKSKGYANESGDIQKVDLGIAMRHFDLACLEQGQKGHWQIEDPNIAHEPNVEYIATWIKE